MTSRQKLGKAPSGQWPFLSLPSVRRYCLVSEVHKATHRPTSTSVALKRILMHNEREGMPITALREIRILKRLNHPNVVQLLEVIVQGSPPSFHMVFPYMDHDLAGLLENDRVQMTPSQIKLYMRQLLEGTAYLHAVRPLPPMCSSLFTPRTRQNHIVHRDMKAANLLISNTGVLRIADFGLARAFDPRAAIVGRRYVIVFFSVAVIP